MSPIETSSAPRIDKIKLICWLFIALYFIVKVILLIQGQPLAYWLDVTNPSLIGIIFYVSVCTLILRWAELEVQSRLPELAQAGGRLIPTFALALWQGREKLWKVFWIYSLIVIVTMNAVQLLGISRELPLLWAVIGIMCSAVVAVALWRCALNTRWRWLGYCARGFAIYMVATSILLVVWQAKGGAA